MTTAIPVDAHGHIAGHLGKAPYIAIVGPAGERQIVVNPMDARTCSGRCGLLETFERAGVTRLLVRHIGQRTLGRFLTAGLKVYRLPPRTNELPAAGELPAAVCELTAAWQGRPSAPRARRHAHEDENGDGAHGCGGACCHDHAGTQKT
ncbi:MAG: NifB/NifX family molybdenum-iron cluster-binding protein [Chromatiales bacterium]|jgi:predicted Fe-Mo cluster-binding NifX family protein|nr:NifB/NifX family molybdenum-iron cluster-binding protein [Chromatiales bacterium]MDX9765745.1 NifB/NifX family molybdenum-iron cluster-binding protein [Ectothiorhodospiraceae bacterium]